ncbi:MAG TPA: hypothetical protein VF109_02170 [Mycobacteriales bacterium]
MAGLVAGLMAAFGLTVVAVGGWSPAAGADTPPGGTDIIRSWPTGQCVDSNDRAEGHVGGYAYSLDCNLGTWQQWQEAPPLLPVAPPGTITSGPAYRLVNQQTQFCLDSNDAGEVYTLPCEVGNLHQTWTRVTPALPADKVPADESLWPVVYRDVATNRCLSIGWDHVLRAVLCGADLPGVTWTDDMFFRRGY